MGAAGQATLSSTTSVSSAAVPEFAFFVDYPSCLYPAILAPMPQLRCVDNGTGSEGSAADDVGAAFADESADRIAAIAKSPAPPPPIPAKEWLTEQEFRLEYRRLYRNRGLSKRREDCFVRESKRRGQLFQPRELCKHGSCLKGENCTYAYDARWK